MTAPIPNLSSLPLKSHHDIVEDAPNGVYCLDCIEDLSTCSSSIIIVRDVISFCKEDTQELENFMSNENNVPQTLNQWGRYLLRRQATFGAAYNFGQSNVTIPYPVDSWPQAVQIALRTAKSMAAELGINPELHNGVHANWYPSGRSGVDPHSDQETDMVKGMPIFSFTLLAGDIVPRNFSIYRPPNAAEIESQQNEHEQKQSQHKINTAKKATKEKDFKPELILLYNIRLGHGDVLIMQGDMQTYYKHAVNRDMRKAFSNARRLNLTVRAFQQTE